MPKPHDLAKRHARELAKLIDEERAAGHVVLERGEWNYSRSALANEVVVALLALDAELSEHEAGWRR
jgi:hypothetical protein